MSAMPPPSYRAWLQKAAHDITAINRVMVGTRVPWDIVCFHAQQAAEKVLKAFPVFHGQTPSKSHDCAYLLSECAKIAPSLAPLRADCRYVHATGLHPAIPILAPIRQRSSPSPQSRRWTVFGRPCSRSCRSRTPSFQGGASDLHLLHGVGFDHSIQRVQSHSQLDIVRSSYVRCP
jgi:hypothetical protein